MLRLNEDESIFYYKKVECELNMKYITLCFNITTQWYNIDIKGIAATIGDSG